MNTTSVEVLASYATTTIANTSDVGGMKPFSVFTHEEATGFAAILGTFTVFGMIANFITFLVIAVNEKLRKNVFNIFLMSLCISDFVSAANSPFVLYSLHWGYYEWNIPVAFCKLKLPMDLWTSAVTIQHILTFTILRLISIQFPYTFRKIKAWHAVFTILLIWMNTCIALFVPMVIWMGVDNTEASKGVWFSCSIQKRWGMQTKRYVQYGFPIIYYFPTAVILLFTLVVVGLIFKRKVTNDSIKTKTTKEVKKEDLAILQLCLIVVSFLIGYVPEFGTKQQILRSQWLFSISSHATLRFSECLNPVFYNFGSSTLRKATKKFLVCNAKCESPTAATSSVTNSSQTRQTAMEMQ